MATAALVVLLHVAGALLLAWGYFRGYRITRPPIGVFHLGDVAFLIVAIVLVPYLYLYLPRALVAGLLLVGMLSVLYFTAEPVLRAPWAVWLGALALAGGDIAAARWAGASSLLFCAVNNAVLLVVVVGMANLWAQSGMKARDAALLAGALVVYDFLATGQTTLTDAMLERLSGQPFVPQVAWPAGAPGQWFAIGLGDLVLASVFPLVMRKAFGRGAGTGALVCALGTIGVLFALAVAGALGGASFPAMVVLGPLMIGQYLYWRRRRGPERTMWQYLEAEPLPTGSRQ